MMGRRGISEHVKRLRRELGLCVDCGGPLEGARKTRYAPVRCAACQRKRTEQKQESREREKQERERGRAAAPKSAAPKPAAAPAPRSAERCRRCVWATLAGPGRWVCAFPVCIGK